MKKMLIKDIRKILGYRKILSLALYSGQTLATYDLILTILNAYLEEKPLTIKELCAGTSKSTLNTRKHINYLLDDGWIELSHGVKDKRLRLIKPTSKLINMVDNLLED